jgi:tRNA(Ile)-lysidine synthase
MHSFPSHIRRVLLSHGVDVDHRIIVAVSGGADSMALLHGLHVSNYTCIVAHVNYGLRGAESDEDENCVRAFCGKNAIALEVFRVKEEDRNGHAGSTQEAARSIRYTWFNDLLRKHQAAAIITAHHANDQTETMLYQFVRGGGGKSVSGMAERSGSLIRPMLAITKAKVLEYVDECAIPWRQDSSNETTHYARNVVRLEWMPIIERMNPTIHDTIQQRSVWMHQEQALVEWGAQVFLEKNIRHDEGVEILAVTSLLASRFMDVVLWKWLAASNFSSQQVVQIAQHIKNESSTEAAWYFSMTHRVCIQGGHIACAKLVEHAMDVIDELPWSNASMSIDYCSDAEVEFAVDSKRQYLDAAIMTFPFTIRTWTEGDRFHPLGAPGQQKISDFLVHAKIPAWRKSTVQVLIAGDEITAVLKHRISEKFKKSGSTQRCVRIQFI